MTLEAVSAMGKADTFIASEDMARQFAHYMAGKPVLFDPMRNAEPVFRRNHPDLKPDEIRSKLAEQRSADMQTIRDTLAAGKTVALLDHGDPTVYGGWQHWLEPEVAGRFHVVTGVSAYNTANALFANEKIFSGISAFSKANTGNLLCNSGSAILTAPASLTANENLLKAVAASGDMVAIFMALTELKTLVPLLQQHYPDTTPVAIAYHAGIARQERIVRTTLQELHAVVEREGERMMGMLYIGKCIR
jgi:precorrin-4 methylase